jgi:hypothetical protein
MNTAKTAMPPILLTSCVIISDLSVSLKDKDARIRLTMESIEKWLAISPELNLVICDGSNFDFTNLVRERFPDAKIECLFFDNNKEFVRLYGKGYGEAEIVKYALLNSTYIGQADYFAKCTAKLWVDNFHECLKSWNGNFVCKGYFENVFSLKKTKFEYVDTRFYLAKSSFYLNYLDAAHLDLGTEHGRSLEYCFKEVVTKQKFEHVMFNVPPVICGVGGGSGTYYKNNLKRRIKEVIRMWIVRKSKAFSPLFV